MATTYPYLWGDTRVSMEQLEGKSTIQNSHPEFWRRLKPMLELGEGRLGVGTCWRPSEVQRNAFLDRHYVVSSGGCCSYEGRRWQLKKGKAHAAPPGKSFHEVTFHGFAQACDAVGDLAWMHSVEKQYGLKDFRNVGSEPWHIQMTEISNSVTGWKAVGSPQPMVWKLPDDPEPPKPKPPPEEDEVTDDDVKRIAKAVWAEMFTIDQGPKPAGWILGQDYTLTQRAVKAAEEAAKNTRP